MPHISSACTILHVESYHGPDVGRVIINDNFDCLSDAVHNLEVISATGSTTVLPGTNTSVVAILSGVPNYTVSVVDEPIFTSVSATTISADTYYLGSTLLEFGGSSFDSNITVVASGTDTYTGVGTPTITEYTATTIYLTQFANANTVTAVTLNIDGVYVFPLVKGTEDGLVALEVGDIQPAVTYYLTYDGTYLQFFTSSPEGTPSTYTNLTPTTTTIGGVLAGTTFSGSSWQSVFNALFYPSLVPTFTAFSLRTTSSSGSSIQSQTLEVGNSISGGSRAFTWTTSNPAFVQSNSIKIYSGSTQISTPTSGMTNDSAEVITITNLQKILPASHTFSIKGTRTSSVNFTSSFAVSWRWLRMFGTSALTSTTTSDSVYAFSGTGTLTTLSTGTYDYTGAGYKYLFVPTSFAVPTLFKDVDTNLTVAMADATDGTFFSASSGSYNYGTTTVTNQFGISTVYKVYRTKNFLGGDISIIVS